MHSNMAHEVFISHAAADKAVAGAVCAQLQSGGIPCWIAAREAGPVAQWTDVTLTALDRSKVVVWIFRGDESASTAPEVERAVREGIHVVSFRLDDDMPVKELRRHVDRAVNNVKALIEPAGEAAPEPKPVRLLPALAAVCA